ncbi:MAG: HPF/RaiA family ribosome-associated protein [Rhodospirillaceae bacterium]|nr:HPF/RaiA family ribosome-associated protein [Rhodospirillaceae bacterium]
MEKPLEISFANVQHSPAIEAAIRERVDRLERFFDRIVSCRVVFEALQKSHRKGNQYQIKIFIVVPGREIVVDRAGPKDQAHEDWKVALRDSFEAATRQLEEYARKLRGEVKKHQPKPVATPPVES